MNDQKAKRRYQMSKRAENAAQTELGIFSATAGLWHENPLADITLDAVAERAGVSVRTIIRRYGSKEGLFEACIQNDAAEIKPNRYKAEIGDIDATVQCLLADYEDHGDALIRTLAVEGQLEIASRVLQAGRNYHRKWCEQMFAPFLPEIKSTCYEPELMAFIAATDFYLWKLLRRDLNRSLDQTQATIVRLVSGLIPRLGHNA